MEGRLEVVKTGRETCQETTAVIKIRQALHAGMVSAGRSRPEGGKQSWAAREIDRLPPTSPGCCLCPVFPDQSATLIPTYLCMYISGEKSGFILNIKQVLWRVLSTDVA